MAFLKLNKTRWVFFRLTTREIIKLERMAAINQNSRNNELKSIMRNSFHRSKPLIGVGDCFYIEQKHGDPILSKATERGIDTLSAHITYHGGNDNGLAWVDLIVSGLWSEMAKRNLLLDDSPRTEVEASGGVFARIGRFFSL